MKFTIAAVLGFATALASASGAGAQNRVPDSSRPKPTRMTSVMPSPLGSEKNIFRTPTTRQDRARRTPEVVDDLSGRPNSAALKREADLARGTTIIVIWGSW